MLAGTHATDYYPLTVRETKSSPSERTGSRSRHSEPIAALRYTMQFSIIVPVYNTGRHLGRCLAALRGLDYPRDEYEILMVDNNSTDNSPSILAAASDIRTLREAKQGSYAARNLAVRESRGRYLVFTDSDCMPDSGWLRAIEAAFENPRFQLILGPRRPEQERWLMRLVSEYETQKDQLVFSSDSADLYYGFTNNMAVRRSTFDAYGPFEDRPRGADTIFVRRVVNGEGCGAVAYANDMVVRHAELDGVATYYKKMFIYGRSRTLYQHIMATRPLNMAERLRAFRACGNGGVRSTLGFWLLAFLLAGGVAAWNLGSWTGRWQQRRS
jgi:glycosyltransferase involved in cell wall biosynthesis